MGTNAGTTVDYQLPHADGAEVRRARRRRAKAVLYVTLALLLAGVIWVLYVCMGVGRRSRTVERPGPVQVVGNESVAWLFLDVERSVWSPALIAGPPRRRVVERVAVEFNSEGVLQCVSLPVGARDTFNENLSTVFGLDDGVYMLGPTPDEIWRWDGRDFVFLSSKRDFAKLPELAGTAPYREEPVLDAASGRHGWTTTRDNDFGSGVPFNWQGGAYRLEPVTGGSQAYVRLRRVDAGRTWEATVATYDAKVRAARAGD